METASAYCDYCKRHVLGQRDGVNHVLFAILTLFSCGLFGIIWVIVSLTQGGYACPTCGGGVTSPVQR